MGEYWRHGSQASSCRSRELPSIAHDPSASATRSVSPFGCSPRPSNCRSTRRGCPPYRRGRHRSGRRRSRPRRFRYRSISSARIPRRHRLRLGPIPPRSADGTVGPSPATAIPRTPELRSSSRTPPDGAWSECTLYSAVRRERRHSSAGANPARQLSLQPVAVGADGGGNDIRLKHSDAKGPPRAAQRPCRPQGLERCAGLETGNAEADPPVKRGRLLRAGKRATGAPARSAGVLAAACMEGGSGRNAGSPAGGVAHANRRPVRARSGRTGWRRSSYYRGGRVMPAEGRSFRWKGWRKGAGSREWLTPSTPEMSSNAGRRHMHKRRGRP